MKSKGIKTVSHDATGNNLGYWKTKVNEAFEKNSDILIENSMADHAVYLMSKIFQCADKNVCISTGKLPNKVRIDDKGYITTKETEKTDDAFADNELIASAFNFFKKNEDSLLEIIITDINEKAFKKEENVFLKKLKEFENKIKICFINDDELSKICPHFIFNDVGSYRYEKNNGKVEAFAQAFAPEEVEKIKAIFQKLKTVCTPMTIPVALS